MKSPQEGSELFDGMRPSIVVDEGTTEETLRPEVVADHALQSVSNLTVKMRNQFENPRYK